MLDEFFYIDLEGQDDMEVGGLPIQFRMHALHRYFLG